MAGAASSNQLVVRTCGKHGCSQPAVCRIRVISMLNRSQHLSCTQHVEQFAKDLQFMLRLDQHGEWRISLESLGWTGALTRPATREA